MEKNEINEMKVVGASTPIQVGDPIAYQTKDFLYQGKVENFKPNGDVEIKVYNSKEVKNLVIPKGEKIEPMFYEKNNEKIWLKYSNDEIMDVLKSNKDVKVTLEKGSTIITSLMRGDKTGVISCQTKIDDNFHPVEGRLQMKRHHETGGAYIVLDVKFKELNLDRPIYGKSLDQAQKDQLLKTGELGLVAGFRNRNNEEFKLWVSLDTDLNKVVTAKEHDIYISKVFGTELTQKQIEDVKSGKGTLLDIKNEKRFVMASAAEIRFDKLKIFNEKMAKELKLIPEAEEKKNSKSKGVKL